MGYNTKNHTEQGGDVTRFGGKVIFEEGCQIDGLPKADNLPSNAQTSDLINALKEAGIMEPDAWSLSAGLAPTPTEDVLVRNKGKVSSVTLEDGKITVTVDPDELEESASSEPSQGTHKWLALEIGTGITPVTGLKYNGYQLTDQDISDATATGCATGSFVLYIKAEEVLETPKSFTLDAAGHKEAGLTICVVRPVAE